MAHINQIYSPLQGAIGCDFSKSKSRLYIAEYAGKISSLDMIRGSVGVSSSNIPVQLRGTWTFDFDLGKEVEHHEHNIADIWWHCIDNVRREITPTGSGVELAYIGHVGFGSISAADLQNLTYTSDAINGSDDETNLLTDGAVFAVKTNEGNYAKVQIVTYGYNLGIRWRTYKLKTPYKVLGTGYTQIEDIVLSEDEEYVYVTERGGSLLKVKLSNANRSAATVVSDGMTAPHQISIDNAHDYAYIVEYAANGRLIRIDLKTGAQTVLNSNLDHAIGLLVTSDQNFAYISEQSGTGGRLIKINITNGAREKVVTGMEQPFFLSWADEYESGILTTERDPANRVALIDLTQSPVAVSPILNSVPFRPSSVAVVNPQKLLVCSDNEVNEVLLSESEFNADGPLLLGIGHVPVTDFSLNNGYATTDPNYFFKVVDAPFGGTLSIMFNHEKARSLGANYYRITVDNSNSPQDSTWSDYKWNSAAKRFKLESNSANSNGMFMVRKPNTLWYNHWLGYRLNTTALGDGLHTVKVSLYSTSALNSKLPMEDTFKVMVDNRRARASIDRILHRLENGNDEFVNTCGIVTEKTTKFRCEVTALDNEGHLKSWYLSVLWGDNKSKYIASDSYQPTPTKEWTGISSQKVPVAPMDLKVPGDPTSTHCAHTFYLTVWDRVINGYNHIHRSTFHKSITLMIDD